MMKEFNSEELGSSIFVLLVNLNLKYFLLVNL